MTAARRKSIRADDPAHWSHPLLTAEEERALALRARSGDRAARDELVLKNQRLIISLAKRFLAGGRHSLDDLVSAGNRGLIRAIGLYDPGRGRLTTYAGRWIRQTIRREVQDAGYTVRLPNHVIDLADAARRVARKFEAATGREPTFDEVCAALKVRESVRDCLRSALAIYEAEFFPFGHDLPEREAPRDPELDEARRLGVERLVSRLTPVQARVIRLLYGIGAPDGRGVPLRKLAADSGVRYQAVQQTRDRALLALRRVADDDLRRLA